MYHKNKIYKFFSYFAIFQQKTRILTPKLSKTSRYIFVNFQYDQPKILLDRIIPRNLLQLV